MMTMISLGSCENSIKPETTLQFTNQTMHSPHLRKCVNPDLNPIGNSWGTIENRLADVFGPRSPDEFTAKCLMSGTN